MNRVCVFCGSSSGRSSVYRNKARELGRVLAQKGIALVYGGGDVGLMGELAQAALDGEGYVIGIIPQMIHEKVGHFDLSELHVVNDMHERKAMMYDLADGFIILPGGIGTVEEFFEVFTWYQLGLHLKPIGMLNIENYFLSLNRFLERMVREGFLKQAHRDALLIEEEPASLIDRMEQQKMLYFDKLGP